MAVNAACAYKTNAIQTANKSDLTLMLYEGAIKFCNIALLGLEKKDIEKTNLNIQKAQNIIAELKGTLNHDYPVAKDFENVYNCIYDYLVEANIKKDSELLQVALRFIKEMRDLWKEVMKTCHKSE